MNCQGKQTPADSVASSSSLCIAPTQLKSSAYLTKSSVSFKKINSKSKLLVNRETFSKKLNQKLDTNGVTLSVMVRPGCIKETGAAANSSRAISQDVTKNLSLNKEMSLQSFQWKVNNEQELSLFENKINSDDCIYAAGLNLTYKMSSSDITAFNDPKAASQKHLSNLNFPAAHDVFYNEETGIQKLNDSGNPVIVAVLDTGVAFTHKDIVNNIWERSDGVVGVNASSLGDPNVDEDNDPYDTAPNSHGTHVAGIIAAEANNEMGGSGLAPSGGVKIMPVRVFNSADDNNTDITSSTVDVTAGILWAIQNGADVINLSLERTADGSKGDSVRDPILELAITHAIESNVFIVFAAGNGGGSTPSQEITNENFTVIPARYGAEFEGAITVGSYDIDSFARSSFSHFSSKYVEIGAPGREAWSLTAEERGIFSTASPIIANNQVQDQYHRLEGTSMAAPMVSAAAALAKALIRQNLGQDPSVAELERLIKESSLSSSHLLPDFENGQSLDLARLAVKVVADYRLEIELGELESLRCP